MRPTPIERFWSKVKIGAPWDCWEWQATKTRKGYGMIWWEGKNQSAHRVSYQISRGYLDPELYVLHLCDNPACQNPCHLDQGTHQDNMDQRKANGHYETGDNHYTHRRPEWRRRGSKNPAAKLNEWQAIAVMARWLQGTSKYRIARDLGISEYPVRAIVNGMTWAHLFAPEEGG